MKVLSGHLDRGLGTKVPHSDQSAYCQQCFEVVKPFVKIEVKNSVAGSCTI